jgi:hypothetical protein
LFSRTELASQLGAAAALWERQRQHLIADGVLASFGDLAPWTVLHLGGVLPESLLQILRKREDIDATANDVRWLREQRCKLIDLGLTVLPELRARLLKKTRVKTVSDVFTRIMQAFPPADLRRLVSLEMGMRPPLAEASEPRVIAAGHWPFGGPGLLLAVVAHVDAEVTEGVTFDGLVRALPSALRPHRDGPSYANLWRAGRSADVDSALDMWPALLVRRRDALATADAIFEAELAEIRPPEVVELPEVRDDRRPWLKKQLSAFVTQVTRLVDAGVDIPDLTTLLPPPPQPVRRLERRRDGWWGIDGLTQVHLGNGRGINRVARLLGRPDEEIPANQLDAAPLTLSFDLRAVRDAFVNEELISGPLDRVDAELRRTDAAHHDQLRDLQKKIEVARELGNDATSLETQAAQLAAVLSSTRNATGKTALAKAANAVGSSIADEQKRVQAKFPALADAIGRISCGQRLVFKPAPGERWTVTEQASRR